MFKFIKKQKLKNIIISILLLIFIIAVYAPFIASDKPLLIVSEKGIEFPVIRNLMDKNFFESGMDIFYNLVSIDLPFFLLIFFLFRLRKRKILIIYLIIHILIFLYFVYNPGRNIFVDYKNISSQKGETIIWTPVKFSSREIDFKVKNPSPPDENHILGTDPQGRDVFARMLFGTRVSLTIGIFAVIIYSVIGIFLGAIAGYFGGWTDMIISRIIEVVHCFPPLFLILTFAAFIEERTVFHIMLLIGISSWPLSARLIRSEFLKHKKRNYVKAAISLGLPKRRIIFRHILPNAISPLLVTATFGVATSILIEASLSFIGLGDPTIPSWGNLLNSGRLEGKIWLVLPPGIAIFTMVSLFNFLGEGIKQDMNQERD